MRVSEATAPRDFEDLRALVIARRPTMPRRLAQIAAFAIENPDEIAFGTAAEIARKAEVQPSTLVRFAQALGYLGFSDLQAVFRQRLRDRWPTYEDRLRSLRAQGTGDQPVSLFEGFVESAYASLARAREGLSAAAFGQAVSVLAQARTIYVLGQRRAFPVTAYLAYAFGKLGVRVVLIDNVAGLAPEQGGFASGEDALLAISFTPYSPVTVDFTTSAARRGVPVVAVTDSPFSPLTQAADVVLEVVEADFAGFRSLAATLCLASALAVAVGERRVEMRSEAH